MFVFQKETTIRELTDRLYFETEKNKGYYNSPKYHQYMVQSEGKKEGKGDHRRSSPNEAEGYYVDRNGHPVRYNQMMHNRLDQGDLAEKYRYSPGMERPFKSPKLQRREIERLDSFRSDRTSLDDDDISLHQLSADELDLHLAQIHATPVIIPRDYIVKQSKVAPNTNKLVKELRKTPSPNEDSAIENVSPSSESSERGSFQETSALRKVAPPVGQTSDYEMEYIDKDMNSNHPWYLEGLEGNEYPFSPQLPTSTPKPKKLKVSQI